MTRMLLAFVLLIMAAQQSPSFAEPPSQQAQINSTMPQETPVTGGVSLSGPSADTLPRDITPWGMYENADAVVKSVMVGLAAASVLAWTIALAKAIETFSAVRRTKRAYSILVRCKSLREAQAAFALNADVVGRMVISASDEITLSEGTLLIGSESGVKERVSSRLAQIVLQSNAAMRRGIGILATIGSIGPFVGLFGTVWGIMRSFIGISQAQTMNLSVVAPGIAEALLATALGLVAAVPAVVLYNVLVRWLVSYRLRLSDAAAVIERIVSREVDYRKAGYVPRGREFL